MNVSKELLERAKTTKSAEELLEMAKGGKHRTDRRRSGKGV